MNPLLRDHQTCNHPNPARRIMTVHEGYERVDEDVVTNEGHMSATQRRGTLENKKSLIIICSLCGLHTAVDELKRDLEVVTANPYVPEAD